MMNYNVNNVQFLLLYIAVYFLFKFFYKRGMLRIAHSWVEHKRTLITVMPSRVKVNGE